MKVSIIVPCYNEEGNIQPIVQEFIDVAKHNDMELILVDNGSADTTSEKIDQMVEKYDLDLFWIQEVLLVEKEEVEEVV